MMDQNQSDLPDGIGWKTSGIIIKQIALIAISFCGIIGVVVTPEMAAKITSISSGVVIIGFALWTIHNRIKQPCPPIVPKQTEGKIS